MTDPDLDSRIEAIADRCARRAAEETLSAFESRYGLEPHHWVYLRAEYERAKQRANWWQRAVISVIVTVIGTLTLTVGNDAARRWVIQVMREEQEAPAHQRSSEDAHRQGRDPA